MTKKHPKLPGRQRDNSKHAELSNFACFFYHSSADFSLFFSLWAFMWLFPISLINKILATQFNFCYINH